MPKFIKKKKYRKEFFKMCPFINFFPVIGTNKIICLTSILNNINQILGYFANRKHIHSILVI